MRRYVCSGVVLLAMAMSLSLPAPAGAGILNGHPSAFGGVTGSVPFNNGVGLSGTIDFAVFEAVDFNANFAGLGYVPGDVLVYTYQVFVTGNSSVSAEIIGVSNPANTIGTFDIGDVNASSAAFTPNARWLFSPSVPSGMSSWGLAFSSPNLPIVGASLTIDGGTQALVAGVPTPGPVALPEPASLLFAGPAVFFALASRGLTRRRRQSGNQ